MGNLGNIDLEKLLRSIVELDIETPNAKELNSGYILPHDGSCIQIPSVRHDRIALTESIRNRQLSERLVQAEEHAKPLQQQLDEAASSPKISKIK